MVQGPSLSVIVATFNAQETIRPCLRSLEAQTARDSLEVILVDSSRDDTAGIVSREFPWARRIVFSERKYCGEARNAGLAEARGRLIAFLDADCTAQEDWAEKILKAHEEDASLAIGGAIANGNPQSLVGWAAYFCEFSDWMPGGAAGPRTDIAGANMSYKREVFDRFGTFIPGTYGSDTEFHWRLGRAGMALRFEPSIRVAHHNIASMGKFLRHEFQHGRSFARVRAVAQGFSPFRRAAYALLSGLIAVKLMLQIARRNSINPVYRRQFFVACPLTFLGVVSWSLGEAFGYVRTGRRHV